MFDDDMRPMVFNTQFAQALPHQVERRAMPPDQDLPSLRDLMPDLVSELEENIRRDRAAAFEAECYDSRIIAVVAAADDRKAAGSRPSRT